MIAEDTNTQVVNMIQTIEPKFQKYVTPNEYTTQLQDEVRDKCSHRQGYQETGHSL